MSAVTAFETSEREPRYRALLDELDAVDRQYGHGEINMDGWRRGIDEARRRYWHGPSLVAAADGKYHVTLNGLNRETRALSSSVIVRCVVMDDAEDLAFEVERFKRDWRKRGGPFDTVEVEQDQK